MVVHTTCETTTSGVFTVLSNTSVTSRDMATVLASLREMGRHFLFKAKEISISIHSPKSIRAAFDPSSYPSKPITRIYAFQRLSWFVKIPCWMKGMLNGRALTLRRGCRCQGPCHQVCERDRLASFVGV